VLAEHADAIGAAFERHGLAEAERRVRGEWAAVRLARPAAVARTGVGG
jgi:hypothetical protein